MVNKFSLVPNNKLRVYAERRTKQCCFTPQIHLQHTQQMHNFNASCSFCTLRLYLRNSSISFGLCTRHFHWHKPFCVTFYADLFQFALPTHIFSSSFLPLRSHNKWIFISSFFVRLTVYILQLVNSPNYWEPMSHEEILNTKNIVSFALLISSCFLSSFFGRILSFSIMIKRNECIQNQKMENNKRKNKWMKFWSKQNLRR